MFRFGILGAARIAPLALIQPAALLHGVSVAAVAASSLEKAQAFADDHNIDTVAESYAALVESSQIDAIYNALPPNLHEEWSIAALKAGKHVLCEKPLACSAKEALEMASVSEDCGRCLMEAFMRRMPP